MERSSKHGPRLDDTMSAEAQSLDRASRESRVEESREKEPAGDGQPEPDTLVAGDVEGTPPTPAAIGHDALELRSEIAANLRRSAWPANRRTLERIAAEENAPDRVRAMLRRLPEGREFENVQDVWRTLGGDVEETRA